MMTIHIDILGDLIAVECKGRITREESVLRLRDVVQANAGASIIVLDLSEVEAIGGGGLGMLAFLRQWARERNIRFKLLSPSKTVMEGLVQTRSVLDFEIASFHEMMKMLIRDDAGHQYPQAA